MLIMIVIMESLEAYLLNYSSTLSLVLKKAIAIRFRLQLWKMKLEKTMVGPNPWPLMLMTDDDSFLGQAMAAIKATQYTKAIDLLTRVLTIYILYNINYVPFIGS